MATCDVVMRDLVMGDVVLRHVVMRHVMVRHVMVRDMVVRHVVMGGVMVRNVMMRAGRVRVRLMVRCGHVVARRVVLAGCGRAWPGEQRRGRQDKSQRREQVFARGGHDGMAPTYEDVVQKS